MHNVLLAGLFTCTAISVAAARGSDRQDADSIAKLGADGCGDCSLVSLLYNRTLTSQTLILPGFAHQIYAELHHVRTIVPIPDDGIML